MNRIIKINKKLASNMVSGLLLGSSIAMTTQVQASNIREDLKRKEQEQAEIAEKKDAEEPIGYSIDDRKK
jgi:hypothetical protein